MNNELTHLDSAGNARMVDVGDKPTTAREAISQGRVRMLPETLANALRGDAKKGSVRAAAELAGIIAAKRTAELIALCHQISLSSVKIDIASDQGVPALAVTALRKHRHIGREEESDARLF